MRRLIVAALVAVASPLQPIGARMVRARSCNRGATVVESTDVEQPETEETQSLAPTRGGLAGAGVQVVDDMARHLPKIHGVQPGGPAETASLREGDLILRVGDTCVEYASEAASLLRGAPESSVTVVVERDGDEMTVEITRDAAPAGVAQLVPAAWVRENVQPAQSTDRAIRKGPLREPLKPGDPIPPELQMFRDLGVL